MSKLNKQERDEKWSKIKEEYSCRTTEEIFNLNDPVEYQCKFIDEVVKTIKGMQKELKYSKQEDEDGLRDIVDSVSWDIGHLDDEVNQIRSAIEEVREWGNQWKELCKRIILEHGLNIDEINTY